MPETISSGLTLTIPKRGEPNWDAVMRAAMVAISGHDHSGGGKGLQVSTSALAANSITNTLIRLASEGWLRSRNAGNTADLNLVRADSSDKLRFDNVSADTRSDLGLALGSDVQAYDADLAAIAALSPSNNDILLRAGGVWTNAAEAAVKAALNLEIGTDVQAYDADLTTLGAGGAGARAFLGLTIGSDVQAYDADLATIAGLVSSDGHLIYRSGSAWTSTDLHAVLARNSGTWTPTYGVNVGTASFTHKDSYWARLGPVVFFFVSVQFQVTSGAPTVISISTPTALTGMDADVALPASGDDGGVKIDEVRWRAAGSDILVFKAGLGAWGSSPSSSVHVCGFYVAA